MTSTVNTCHFSPRAFRRTGDPVGNTIRVTGVYGTTFIPIDACKLTEDDHRRAAELYLVEHHAPADLSDAPGRLSPSGTAYTFTLVG